MKFHNSQLARIAFTLAETLIVIGIIGVVAALTLPNLNHATGDKEKVTRVKKIYSSLTDAVDRAQVVYGDFNTWFTDIDDDIEACSTRFAKRVTEFLKVSKDCGFSEGCFSSSPLLYSEGDEKICNNFLECLQNVKIYMVMLSDGMSLGFQSSGHIPGRMIECTKIRVDIDGPNKGKNQVGNDIFDFTIFIDETSAKNRGQDVNQLYPYYDRFVLEDYNHHNFSYGFAAWVVENNNLDYLKCPKELNWNIQTSCK